MRKKLFLILIFTDVCYAASDTLPKESTEFNQFQQQNKQTLEQIQQFHQQRWLSQHQYQNLDNHIEKQDYSNICLPFQSIRFSGFTLIDPTPFAPQKGECLNEKRLNQLSQDITQAYLALGYIHNPFQFQNNHSGDLIMRVDEGRITEITSDSPSLNFTMLYPHWQNKPPNVKDLDQALDQANKMIGSQVSVDVFPQKDGAISLHFTNQQKAKITTFIGINNNVSKRYGRWQTNLGVNIDNPFGLSDTLYLNTSHTLKSVHRDFNRSASLYYSLPYGYWTFNAFASLSQFNSQIPLQHIVAEQKGRTFQAGMNANYTFHRGENHISNLTAQLSHSNSHTYFQQSLIRIQSPIITKAKLAISHLQLLECGSLSADLSYERGLTRFTTVNNQSTELPQGRFNKWNLDLYLNHYPQLFGEVWHISHRLLGQYSQEPLPSIEQADFLGRYAIRGFNNIAYSAEKSLVFRNNIGRIFTLNQWQLEPYLLFDLGMQKSTSPNAVSQRALAYGTGINISRSSFFFNLEWATGRLFSRAEPIQQERSIKINMTWSF